MAVRLINLHRQPLRIDLRGGEVLLLASGQRSAALREELLYDNCHLPEWERSGWIARVPARMREVGADAVPEAPALAPAPKKKKAVAAAPPARKAEVKSATPKATPKPAPKKKR
jgi:hypothetical protein